MENLRWILLLAGLLFVVVIYLISRQRSRSNSESVTQPQSDVPDFSATDDLNNVDEGVGEVRIIASFDDDPADDPADDLAAESDEVVDQQQQEDYSEREPANNVAESQADIIMLTILSPTGDEKLRGDQINSAARASGLIFGDMDIFHRLDENNQILFSMANMLKPGSFDADDMYDMETTGLTIFMQGQLVADPDEVLDDMLQTAYQLNEMLGGRLCNHKREPLTEQDTSLYREQVAEITAAC